MSKVGSTVNGLYSTGLQQNRFMSLICLSVVMIHNGSGATLTSRINAVFLEVACFLHSPSRRYHGSSLPHFPEMFFFPNGSEMDDIFLAKSLTCCLPLGSCPGLEHLEIPPRSSATVLYTTSRVFLYHRLCAVPCPNVWLQRCFGILVRTQHDRMFVSSFK